MAVHITIDKISSTYNNERENWIIETLLKMCVCQRSGCELWSIPKYTKKSHRAFLFF